MSTNNSDVSYRSALLVKYQNAGASKAEAERLMLLELFRNEVRFLAKKIPRERLEAAVNEAFVEEVMES